jgi:L-alanine-DL-glutamate epimerase-like enolase superfamily enzyme
MANEKPGGHGERSVAVGTIDMAVWDAVAKIAGKPLYRLLADRYRQRRWPDDRVWVYAAGGYYYPGKDHAQLKAEMQQLSRPRLSRSCKMKIGAAPLDEDLRRIEAVLEVVGDGASLAVDANGRFDLRPRSPMPRRSSRTACSGTRKSAIRSTMRCRPNSANHYDLPMATGENLFSHQDARNLLRHRRHARRIATGCNSTARCPTGWSNICARWTCSIELGWSSRRVVPHGGHQMSLNIAAGLHLGGNESYPDVFQPFGGFADGIAVEDGYVALPDACRASASRRRRS